MCGIVGLIDTVAGSVSPELLFAMRDLMIKRGPDGEGHFLHGSIGMAMRRLSIIDLEHGWQPLSSRNGDVVAFQNGEIYNFRELRRLLQQKGYQFKSDSDTEVLAHGFAEWGMDGLLERIDGMYAISIFDRSANTLYLARDRFGEKPLFYSSSKGRFAYASDLRSLALLPWVSSEIGAKALDYYLALHYIPGEMTFFRDIKRLLPGEYLAVPLNHPLPRTFRYYQPKPGSTNRISDDELAALIEQSVESRLIADVPVGVFLSGGLDSSIVAAVAARKQPGISTFSMGFESRAHDESSAAALVAKTIGSSHHSFLFKEESFLKLLPEVASALDEPVGDQAMLPLYWLCQEARKHVKVVLAGEGADEVFAGYSYYRQFLSSLPWHQRVINWLKSGQTSIKSPLDLLGNSPLITPSGFPLLTESVTRRQLIGHGDFEPSTWESGITGWLEKAHDPLQRATAADLATWLPDDLLVKFDRMAMAHSLEGRAPYLHPAVVEAGLALPQQQRMTPIESKVALRRIASRWLPPEILDRPKQGFVLPMRKWLKEWFDLQGSVEDYVFACEIDFLDNSELIRLIKNDLADGVNRERLLFALLLLFEWYKNQRSFFSGR